MVLQTGIHPAALKDSVTSEPITSSFMFIFPPDKPYF